MKVALPWSAYAENKSLVSEYNITFVNKPGNFDWLLTFLEQHNDKRFNIRIDTTDYDFELEKLHYAKIVNPNIHIIVDYIEEKEILQKMNINFYFSSAYAATSFRQLEWLVNLGTTDIYISDDLCYQLEKVKKFCDQHKVQCRLILDKIASQIPDANNPRLPYFTPEIIDILDQYIDIFEFTENQSMARLTILYKIWFENQEWREDLSLLYPELTLKIPNQSLIPNFIEYKMNCGYKCAYGSPCKRCNQFLEIAKILRNKKIEFTPKRKKE